MLSPQTEGGYTVTSPLIPEFLTEGDTVDDALYNVRDALAVAIEIYQDTGRDFPLNALIPDTNEPVCFETLVTPR